MFEKLFLKDAAAYMCFIMRLPFDTEHSYYLQKKHL